MEGMLDRFRRLVSSCVPASNAGSWKEEHLIDDARVALAVNLLSPLQGATLRLAIPLALRSLCSGHPAYWPRALLLATSGVLNSILACAERTIYSRSLKKVVIPPPLFILGHYRSGTTHLQNLLSLDSNFAFPNLYQAFFPETFLITERILAPLVGLALIRQKLQDGVMLGVDVPMEDEIAICSTTGLSPHMAWALPKHAAEYDRFLTLRDTSPDELARWKSALTQFVQKLTLLHNRPLMLKSPTHTGRIRHLLELFPEAKFVHIHRNPYEVYKSSFNMMETVTKYWMIEPNPSQGENGRSEKIISTYKIMYDAFFEDRSLIPAGRFVDLGYEDLERDPIGSVGIIYEALGLADLGPLTCKIKSYMDGMGVYRKNQGRTLDQATRGQVARSWERSFREWDYPI